MTNRDSTSFGFRTLPALLFVFAFFALVPAIFYGPPLGHSLGNNLVWLSSFDAAIWRGEIYPRWMPELWFGAGAPDFFFYGPLPFWVTSTAGRALCWQCDIPNLLNAGTLVILCVSGCGYYLFAQRIIDREKAFIAAGLYMILPYHLMIDWGVRQALGELAAFAVFPFICYFLVGLFQGIRGSGTGVSVGVAALTFSHLPSVVICACVLVPATLVLGIVKSRSGAETVRFLLAASGFALLGLGLSSIYWLPAFSLLPDVASETLWQTSFNWSHWLFFDGMAEPNPPMMMLLKFWLVFTSVLLLVFAKRLWSSPDVAIWCYLPLIVAWIFMTPVSWAMWRTLPFLQAIQFPWRFMMMAEFGVPLAVAFALPKLKIIPSATMLLVLSLLSGVGGYELGNIMGVSRQIVDGNVADHLSAWEYLPKTAFGPIVKLTGGKRDALRSDWIANPSEISQSGITQLSSRHLIVDVDVPAPTQVIVRQFFWKLWTAHDVATGQMIKLSPETKFGLIAIDAPAGKSKIALDLGWDWSEKLGIGVSLLSAALLLLVGFWRRNAKGLS